MRLRLIIGFIKCLLCYIYENIVCCHNSFTSNAFFLLARGTSSTRLNRGGRRRGHPFLKHCYTLGVLDLMVTTENWKPNSFLLCRICLMGLEDLKIKKDTKCEVSIQNTYILIGYLISVAVYFECNACYIKREREIRKRVANHNNPIQKQVPSIQILPPKTSQRIQLNV